MGREGGDGHLQRCERCEQPDLRWKRACYCYTIGTSEPWSLQMAVRKDGQGGAAAAPHMYIEGIQHAAQLSGSPTTTTTTTTR
eukprot:2173033-Pyramimonas_sp.AAC.1